MARTSRARIVLAGLAGAGLMASACNDRLQDEADWGPDVPPTVAEETFEVPPPPFSEGIFPCTDCHDPTLPVRTEQREMILAHTDIKLNHGKEGRWCLDCHDVADRDSLHLANGEKVSFEESYRLCGQCHGDKYRDWKVGVHGRRTGNWDGHKSYLLCVSCHNSHSPHFAPLKPMPPPERPRTTP